MEFIGFIFIRQSFHKVGLNVSRFEHEINSLPAKSEFCKNLPKKKSQQLFSIFCIVVTLNGLIWWNKKKFEYFHLTWDSRFLHAVALKKCESSNESLSTECKFWKAGRSLLVNVRATTQLIGHLSDPSEIVIIHTDNRILFKILDKRLCCHWG
jgi:hypothetical protein